MGLSTHHRRLRALSVGERLHIRRALHEGVAQELAAATFLLASVAAHAPPSITLARRDIGLIKEILERNIRNVCELAHAIAADSRSAATPTARRPVAAAEDGGSG